MLDSPFYQDCYEIRVKHDSTGRLTLAYNERDEDGSYKILLTDFDQLWSLETLDQVPTENDLVRAAANPRRSSVMPLLAALAFRACASKMVELEAKVKAQETELRALKRQLSLSSPVEASPTKAQVQAAALKGKSLLNPRVKRAKSKKSGDLFSSSDEE